jgi:hypothetical protein
VYFLGYTLPDNTELQAAPRFITCSMIGFYDEPLRRQFGDKKLANPTHPCRPRMLTWQLLSSDEPDSQNLLPSCCPSLIRFAMMWPPNTAKLEPPSPVRVRTCNWRELRSSSRCASGQDIGSTRQMSAKYYHPPFWNKSLASAHKGCRRIRRPWFRYQNKSKGRAILARKESTNSQIGVVSLNQIKVQGIGAQQGWWRDFDESMYQLGVPGRIWRTKDNNSLRDSSPAEQLGAIHGESRMNTDGFPGSM